MAQVLGSSGPVRWLALRILSYSLSLTPRASSLKDLKSQRHLQAIGRSWSRFLFPRSSYKNMPTLLCQSWTWLPHIGTWPESFPLQKQRLRATLPFERKQIYTYNCFQAIILKGCSLCYVYSNVLMLSGTAGVVYTETLVRSMSQGIKVVQDCVYISCIS